MVSLEVVPLLLLNVSLVADNNHRDTEISDLSGQHTTPHHLLPSPLSVFALLGRHVPQSGQR